MSEVSRRRVLLAAASGIAALAGCAGSETASNSYPTTGPPLENVEVERVRDEDGGALVADGETVPALSTDERAVQRRTTSRVLTSDGDRSALAFAETPPAERLREFCAATDFASSSVSLHTMPVEACREVRFRSVRVERGPLAEGDLQPHVDFCRAYRPADVDCERDAIHAVGFAIRMPVAAERSRGSGRSMAGSCGTGRRPAAFNASRATDGSDPTGASTAFDSSAEAGGEGS
ncbi:hypothetical protein [Halorubrum tropicale]|jgi:hypothetical protein|uniref:Lipoprotein n=1 Tax=Halorubrum tropicale TaxID=1765655 RepID=A0A0M9ASR2_9EURY|nr:hypothetical protein [Halorubrum tropicale]KOX98077.1 hypothetical protein AMR74_04035 [Halorubrum tropicale]